MNCCDTCQWWETPSEWNELPEERGRCRREPPARTDRTGVDGEWPLTYCDDWCGEHRARDCDPVVGGKAERRG